MTNLSEGKAPDGPGVECIFLTEYYEADLKCSLDEMSKSDELLEEYLENRRSVFMNEKMLSIYQGGRILVGIVLKSEYKLCDVIFDLSNSEKQSVLSNFTWEGQYQVLVTKENNYLEIYNETRELNSLVNLDDGSYINLVGAYNLEGLNSKMYIFQCSIIIKPQYWNDLLNFDILIKYHQNDGTLSAGEDITGIYDEFGNNRVLFGDILVLNEVSNSEIFSYSLSKPIFIKVPLTISNYFLQESSQILFIEVLNIGESFDSIIIRDIFSHNLKLNGNSPLDLPFTLNSNQSLGCSLIRVNNKKTFKPSKNSDEKNGDGPSFLPVIIPIFIKWESTKPNSKLILTQFALQINFDQKVKIFHIGDEYKSSNTDISKQDQNNNVDNVNSSSLSSSSSAASSSSAVSSSSSYLFSPSSPHDSAQSIHSPFTQEICYSSKLNHDENSNTPNHNHQFEPNNNLNSILSDNDLENEPSPNFKATCTFDRISKYPGETVYLLIEVFPHETDKSLNLLVTVEYNQTSPIVPVHVSMPINYFPESESSSSPSSVYEHPALLYPIKICYPGIYKCPSINIYDFDTKTNYSIKRLPLLVCESLSKEHL